MCGIWFSAGPQVERDVIDVVAYRGPDGSGWREFESAAGRVAIGHRRLAIIDLDDEAAQPMDYLDGTYVITYNGELYNYLELRDELRRLNRTFRTQSDTEVILAAYAEWGTACLDRMLGMFAFVIYEPDRQRVFAARDRFGIKPLYWHASPTGIAFASEIKQFAKLRGFRARLNHARAYDYLVADLRNHTNDTLFRDVGQVRGGEFVCFDLPGFRGGVPAPKRYYAPAAPGTIPLSEAEAADRFYELFVDSIRLHLRADVTVGSCLSGGLDSSSIVCVMAEQLRKSSATPNILTVSSAFEEKKVDERPYIEAVVRHAGVRSTYVFPTPSELAEIVDRLVWHQDEPFGSTSIFAQWCVFRRAAETGLKVMLDGQGADEQLAGYHGSFAVHLSALIARKRYLEGLWTIFKRWLDHDVKIGPQFATYFGAFLPGRVRNLLAGPPHAAWPLERLLRLGAFSEADSSQPPYLAAMKRNGLEPPTDLGLLCQGMVYTNLPLLLHFEDRNSMAHSVEARVPFLDHRLVDFSIGLGSSHKIVGSDTKRVLRRAMKRTLPEPVLRRKDKLGFPTPEEVWFKGPLKPKVIAWVDDAIESFPNLIEAQGFRQMATEMLEGRRAFDFTLWRFVCFGIWGRVFGVSA